MANVSAMSFISHIRSYISNILLMKIVAIFRMLWSEFFFATAAAVIACAKSSCINWIIIPGIFRAIFSYSYVCIPVRLRI